MATDVAYTIGLSAVQFGTAATNGTMPSGSGLTKVGKVYKDSAQVTQSESEVTEHYEEGVSVPSVRSKTKAAPVVKFSLMVDDLQILVDTIGGSLIGTSPNYTGWGFDGDDVPADKAVKLVSKQGLDIEIPNGDIDAVINDTKTKAGIFLVDVTVTPKAVSAGKAFRYVKKSS